MATIEAAVRPELLAASDREIEDAVAYADPMVLRGLLYQLTGDPDAKAMQVKRVMAGLHAAMVPASDDDAAMIRRKAVDFLKAYRDAGAGPIGYGPPERVPESMSLVAGRAIPPESIRMALEEIGFDPWARSLRWQVRPDPARLENFSVAVIGTGVGGLNAALQLKRAGIPFTVIEKNAGVGGTWFENRYPGARLDTPSRMYTHIFGVDYTYPQAFCDHVENRKYFEWVADTFDLRGDIRFETEVREMAWDEEAGLWDVRMDGPEGERTQRFNAVLTAVGFLNRPSIPEIEGAEDFGGEAWHTARWPQGKDLRGKRIAVIGTGCTGYQTVPELAAIEGAHVTVFQRTPQWLLPIPGYLAPVPEQVRWLDRNLPFHTNFMRFKSMYRPDAEVDRMFDIDPDFDDPHSVSEPNKASRDECIAFLKRKLGDPALVEAMTPKHPFWSARPVLVDSEASVLDALLRDNVTLVTSGVRRIDRTGIEANDGSRHDVDVIVYATGFHANDYLYPMKIAGRGGKTIDQLWAQDGARAYLGCMMPGFPNLWAIYGPNTNGGLPVAAFHEMTALYAMQCMERLIMDGKRAVEVKEDAYWRYNRLVDERNRRKVWSDPRAHNYYWTRHGRSATMNPFGPTAMWQFLEHPDFAELEIR